MSFVSLLQSAPQQGQGSLLMSVVPFILIIGIFWLFIIRPQNKKQKETEKMINALKKGDKVVTIGGIHGVVSSTKEKTVIVKVDSSTSMEFNRSAIAAVVVDKPAEKKSNKSNKAKKDEPKAEEVKAEAEVKEEAPAEAPAAESSENK